MSEDRPIYEPEQDEVLPDPDEIPIRDRRIFTQPYDLVVESLIHQIKGQTIFLRPLSERPHFQRRYVWPDRLASRLIESIILNIPIPACFLSQNEEFELDVIDGQQRLYSIFRFCENQFALTELEVLSELNNKRFFELHQKLQRQIRTHTLRLVAITNESHPEIKFDVFERLNTNTVPLNSQELRNCIYRGSLNECLKDAVTLHEWLEILGKKLPDKRMRDEELVLRFFSFHIRGLDSYRTPQKHWLNETAKLGKHFDHGQVTSLRQVWSDSIAVSRVWFDAKECFRKFPQHRAGAINRGLFDLIMMSAASHTLESASSVREEFRLRFGKLCEVEEFSDLISRAVDHTKRTKRRWEMWKETFTGLI